MSVTITLTDAIRNLPYFRDFKEFQVEVPDKPFLREILDAKISPEMLTNEDLCKCITTCIYFGLNSTSYIQELFWNLGETEELFNTWFVKSTVPPIPCVGRSDSYTRKVSPYEQNRWTLKEDVEEPLKSELILKWGRALDRPKLIQLGARFVEKRWKEIAFYGNLRLLHHFRHPTQAFLIRTKTYSKRDSSAASGAARSGHLHILKYLHENRGFWDNLPVFNNAAAGGTAAHLECLKYAHIIRRGGYQWDKTTFRAAVACGTSGHFEIVKYLHENKCPWDKEVFASAAKQGNLEIVKYLHEKGCPWDENTTAAAAGGGWLEILRYLHAGLFNEQTSRQEGGGCPWNENVCWNAARGKTLGHLECLKYAREGFFNEKTSRWEGGGCPWNSFTFMYAMYEGNLESLKYVHAGLFNEKTSRWEGGGCTWDEKIGGSWHGNLETLKYARDSGMPWSLQICRSIARSDDITCLQYMHENGGIWNMDILECIMEEGYVEALRYFHSVSTGVFPWNIRFARDAAENGFLEILKFARENGCPWDERVCSNAASMGHFECLQYAHENGCPWDQETCILAINTNQFECLKYAWENQCSRSEEIAKHAMDCRNFKCLRYLVDNGCPNAEDYTDLLDENDSLEESNTEDEYDEL